MSYELAYLDTNGEPTVLPFSKALAVNGELPTLAANRMSVVDELGWPTAMLTLHYGPKHKKRIVKKDDAIYLLKCWPDCWRLYFYVRQDKRYFVYVHAVCKQQDEEDPADAEHARRIYDQRARSAGLWPVQYPAHKGI